MKLKRAPLPTGTRVSRPAAAARAAAPFELQPFEPRVLMSVTTLKDSAVVLKTNVGEIAFALNPTAPQTIANFLKYVDAKLYDNTVVHRAVSDFVVQAGGFKPPAASGSSYTHIPTFAPVVNEFSASRPNVRGTVAMAKVGGDPNSATSEFFINVNDNRANLDNQNGGFTVFARVIRGMGIADLIESLPQSTQSGTTTTGGSTSTTSLQNFPKIAGFLDVKIASATKRDLTTVTIGAGSNDRAVRFNDGDNVIGTVSLAGGGAASIKVTGTNLTTSRLADGTIVVRGTGTELQSVDTTGTTARSTLRLTGGGAYRQLDVGSITADSTIGTVEGGATIVHGDVTLAGGARRVNLMGVQDAGTVSIGSASSAFNANPVDVNLAYLTNASFNSTQPVGTLTTQVWEAGGDFITRTFTAPAIGTIQSFGLSNADRSPVGFGANFTVTGAVKRINVRFLTGSITAGSIGTAVIGSMSGGSLVATSSIGTVTVSGPMSNATVRSAGSIGRVTAATMTGSNVYAGITAAPTSGQYPTSFTNANASIGAVRVYGGPKSFSKSRIAAPTIGSATLGRVETRPLGSNKLIDATAILGVKAGKVGSLSAVTQDGQPLHFKNLDTQAAFDAEVTRRKLNLYRFSVVLI